MSALDFESTSKTITAGRFELHYHEAGENSVAEPENSVPVLFLHGSGPGVTAWSNFAGNFPVFAEQFHTILLDMPGFGKSGDLEWEKAYPQIAAEAIDAFCEAKGIEKVDIVGNSMGGNVACEAALAYPDRVRKMALMGPGGLAAPLFTPEPSEGSRRLFEFLADPTDDKMSAWVDTMVGNKKVVSDELIRARTEAATAPGAVERMYSIFGSILKPENAYTPLYARASQIRQETLIIWGRDDRMLPYEQAHFAFRQLPKAELHAFSRCGHWAMIEQKDKFERLVIDFFTH